MEVEERRRKKKEREEGRKKMKEREGKSVLKETQYDRSYLYKIIKMYVDICIEKLQT